ncbi:SPFH domain-containing protein [Simiduia aestuariiviva]|uniref:Regulator of protease activity HflC (Stomatin/prohibitin superfamily) n=1 Tax=Simiduia aestuariiviva TaxID=1510459 RepID=A0A839UK33_9GAMM|nr:SPFH domain-containing protein [Simiduia aestuariiviva]MBB3166970.1 regulator of protease activity HflC (stomatin/prohibitin superfamily) [Simiduia aestuariiviva]
MGAELDGKSRSGYTMIFVLLACQIGGIFLIATAPIPLKVLALVFSVIVLICWFGLYMVHPNQGKVLQLFGNYKGTDRTPGLRWNNPLYAKRAVSLRVRNFESGRLKVNDANGNPIEIAAVVVWRVVDTYDAVFEVDDYENYVSIQSEAALRNLATTYPYEHDADDERLTLRGHSSAIADKLRTEVQDRLGKAGVEVLEARLSHLAYAQEIAQAMLQRQQASAVLAARKIIVQGAVGMVKDAIEQLASEDVVELDDERKAAMVSNLLVVLCGENNAQPVLNTGSLY